MRINIDRLCELAGVPGARRTRGGLIREGSMRADDKAEGRGHGTDEGRGDDDSKDEGRGDPPPVDEYGDIFEKVDDDPKKDDPMEEIVEINEADLVKERRRARVMMNESRKREARRRQNLQEAQLKAIIDQEVKNVLKELNLNSGWMYGKKKPTRSRKGYTHQGAYLKGLGFK